MAAAAQGAKISFNVDASEIAVQYRRCVSKPAPVALTIVDGDEANAVRLDARMRKCNEENCFYRKCVLYCLIY